MLFIATYTCGVWNFFPRFLRYREITTQNQNSSLLLEKRDVFFPAAFGQEAGCPGHYWSPAHRGRWGTTLPDNKAGNMFIQIQL